MPESPWYTVEQAAVILQKNPETIRRLCQRNQLEGARKIGREWLIPRTTVDPTPVEKPSTPQAGKESA